MIERSPLLLALEQAVAVVFGAAMTGSLAMVLARLTASAHW